SAAGEGHAMPDEQELGLDGPTPDGQLTVSAVPARRTPRGTLSRRVLLGSAPEIVHLRGGGAPPAAAPRGPPPPPPPTALSRPSQNKTELHDALADLMIRGDAPLPATGDPAADLRENLRQLRRGLLRYPTLAPSLLRLPPGTGSWWDRMEHALGALR